MTAPAELSNRSMADAAKVRPADVAKVRLADAAKVRPVGADPRVQPGPVRSEVVDQPVRSSVRRAAPTQPLPASPRLPWVPWAVGVLVALWNVPGLVFVRPFVRPARAVHLVAAVAVTLVVISGLGWLGWHAAAGAGIPAETTVVRVGTGETVWDVAQRVAPEADTRAVVQRIRQLNGMVGSAVQPGQRLQVPDGR